MTQTISSPDDFRQKIQTKRYGFFTFPQLEATIQYRMPDLLKLAFNNSLPAFLAEQVIAAYKAYVSGNSEAFLRDLKEKSVEADDSLIKDLSERGYELLSDLCVSHRIMNVPESDFDSKPLPLISWNDIPENDAIAFTTHLITAAQTADTKDGGEVSAADIATFPDGERVKKRRAVRQNG